jgi:hypothetical protein
LIGHVPWQQIGNPIDLRERIGTITWMNTKTYSLICDGEQWRVSPGLLRKIIDL